MSPAAAPMTLQDWLAAEMAEIEGRLQAAGPVCQLDRRGEASPDLKALEGRYFVLRRADRLLQQGASLQALKAEADKAKAFAAAAGDGARGRTWAAYGRAVADAVQEVLDRAGAHAASQVAGDAGRR